MDEKPPVLSYTSEMPKPAPAKLVFLCVFLALLPEGAFVADRVWPDHREALIGVICTGAVVLIPNFILSIYLLFKWRQHTRLLLWSMVACMLNLYNGWWILRGFLSWHS